MRKFDYTYINDVATRAKDGCQSAEDELWRLSYPWVARVMDLHRMWAPLGHQRADMIQAGVLGVHQAFLKWEPPKWFTHFTEPIIYRRLVDFIQQADRKKHQFLSLAVTLDVPVNWLEDGDMDERIAIWNLPDPSGMGENPADLYLQQDEERRTNALLQSILDRLTKAERAALTRVVLGDDSYTDVAIDLAVTVKSVDNAIQRAKAKVAREILERCAGELDPEYLPRMLMAMKRFQSRPRVSA